MANIKVNLAELKTVFDLTPHNQNIMLLGRHGIGKSEILTEYYTSIGFEVVAVFLGQMSDPGDLLGLPDKKKITKGEIETLIMDFLPPYWWQMDKPFCLLLDEINRGRPEILQVVFDLCLNRKLGGRKLPEGSIVVAAANYGEEYQVTDLDPALVSRFNIYEVAPTNEEWISWAAKKQIDHRIISFITANPSMLDPSADDTADSMQKSPDRRAWVRVDGVLKKIQGKPAQTEMLVMAGIIGPAAAGLFKKHLDAMVSVDAARLLLSKKFEELEPDLITLTMQDLIYLNRQVTTYVVSKQEQIKAKKAVQDLVCKNFLSYLAFLKGQEHNEVIGDLVQSLERTPEAAAVILSDDKIMHVFTEYIDDIELK